MPFNIKITEFAEAHLRGFPVREQRILESAITTRLTEQPETPTKAIIKLRPNPLAQFELRVGDLRVLYNVDGTDVILLVVGRKVRNKLIVEGEDFYGHQDDSTQPPGKKS